MRVLDSCTLGPNKVTVFASNKYGDIQDSNYYHVLFILPRHTPRKKIEVFLYLIACTVIIGLQAYAGLEFLPRTLPLKVMFGFSPKISKSPDSPSVL